MERGNQRIAGSRPVQQIAHASLHLIGSFVREGHGQDGFRTNLQVVDQMGDAVGNDASLPAAGARENKNRAFGGLNSFELLWIEKLTEIHVKATDAVWQIAAF